MKMKMKRIKKLRVNQVKSHFHRLYLTRERKILLCQGVLKKRKCGICSNKLK
ncbi:hypothetical protein Hanom_Chr01g00077801 [Helianthus anomalus]